MESARTPSLHTLPAHHYYHYHPHLASSKSELDTMGRDNAFSSLRHVHSAPISRSRSRSLETASNYLFTAHDSDNASAYTRPQSNISYVVPKARSIPPRNVPVNVNDDVNGAGLRTIVRRHSDGAKYCERNTKVATDATEFIQAITLADLYRPPAMLHPYVGVFPPFHCTSTDECICCSS